MLKLKYLLPAAFLLLCSPALAHPNTENAAQYVTRSLTITGAVEHPLTLTVADLAQRPDLQVRTIPLDTISGEPLRSLENLRGVRLRDLLDEAVIHIEDHNDIKKMVVIAGASDGYKVVFSCEELFNTPNGDDVYVYFETAGQPLPDEEGRIALISGHDLHTGPRHVKWLNAISVVKVAD